MIDELCPYVRIVKFVELTGYTDKAVRSKIEKGVWVEGVHYRRDPEGNIHMNLVEHKRWVEGQPPGGSKSDQTVSGSPSSGRAKPAGKP